MGAFIMAGLLIGAISFTIAFTSIFKWLRELISGIHPKLEELIHCPWCLSHYIAAVFLLTSDFELFIVSEHKWYNWFATLFILVAISGLLHYVLLRAYEPVMQVMTMRHNKKQQAERKLAKEKASEKEAVLN